jgi:hypothetical protein
MSRDTLTLTQEVYFDLLDLLNNNPKLQGMKIEGFEEFKNLTDFIDEQTRKLMVIESDLEEVV